MIGDSPVRIYIAEDSRLLRGALRLHISETSGLQLVGQAATCSTAIAEILALCPDLVLLDIHLEDGEGFEILTRIHQAGQPIVVAMMTFDATLALQKRARELGAHLFFDKASEAGALLDLLHTLGKGTVTLASLRERTPKHHEN